MLATERQKKIMELLLEHSHIEVGTLSNIFGVSEVTIRKDLEKLEQAGFVKRLHGAAVLNISRSADNKEAEADDAAQQDRRHIGKICSELICENDIVFIGDGVLCWNVIDQIEPRNGLTVVTNNLSAVSLLYARGVHNVITIGGSVGSREGCCYSTGVFAETMVSQLQFTKAFLSVSGVHRDFGLSLSDPASLDFYRRVKNNARELCIVCDTPKFDTISMLKFCGISEAGTMIASADIPDEYKRLITEAGVRLYTTISSESDR